MTKKGASSSGPLESKNLWLLLFLFLCSFGLLLLLFLNFPKVSEEDREKLKLPRSLEQAKELRVVLANYASSHFYSVLSTFAAVFIFLQSFSIPGTIFLSFIAGALFGFPIGFSLAVLSSTIGASCCYFLSWTIGRSLVRKLFPQRLDWFGLQIEKHKKNLFNYLLFLRITPLLPNWFINISSPVLGVPYVSFALATFFGIMPPTFLTVKAGLTLHTLNSTTDYIDITSILTLVFFAALSLLPTYKPFQDFLNKIFFGSEKRKNSDPNLDKRKKGKEERSAEEGSGSNSDGGLSERKQKDKKTAKKSG
eukprot:TRINITY_DN1724_c0_g1_i1.p1 TRINITY_DN1724_c0_g1~~TRINITY_DN1724_c0_g1_i1.p1  ORF type:complete len:308 (-),score=75.73 TRINITY_DN1724_c0_g1_i1:114-1037(-)